MTPIGSSYLLSSLTQLRNTNGLSSSEAITTLSKTLSDVADISINGSSVMVLRQNLNEATELLAKVEVTNSVLDGVALRLVALEQIETQRMQLSEDDAGYAVLSNDIAGLQNELSAYVVESSTALKDWIIVSDSTPDEDEFFDFQSWAFDVDETLTSQIATIEFKADDLLAKFHKPDNCYICSGESAWAAAPTTNTSSLVGADSDASTTVLNWDTLRSGSLWDISPDENLSYSYYEGVPYADPYNGRAGGPEGVVTSLDSTQKADHDVVMQAWDDVVDFEFQKLTEAGVNSVGEIRIAYTSAGPNGSAAFAYYPSNSPVGGDTWYMKSVSSNDSFSSGTYGMLTALHEIGHAIGLKHPFSASATNNNILGIAFDNSRYTVMTYTQNDRNTIWNITNSGAGASAKAALVNPVTPMLYDVAFAQENYGVEKSVRSNDTVYTFTTAPEVLQTIVDSGGTDTINASAITRSNIIDLAPGSASSIGYYAIADQARDAKASNPGYDAWLDTLYGAAYTSRLYEWNDNVAIAFSATIENAIGGSAGDQIKGNSVNNEIWGMGGDDAIDGRAGTNTAGYRGNFDDYTITKNVDSTITVVDNTVNRDGTDTLANIASLKFTDFTYKLADETKTATLSGIPNGAVNNAGGKSAAEAAAEARAATATKAAAALRENTPAASVAITRTTNEKRSINKGRMAALAGIAGRVSSFSRTLGRIKTKTTHAMASISASPASYKTTAARASNITQASAYAPAQAPRVQLANTIHFRQAMNVNRAELYAAILRS